jgi:hypothetical protein
MILGLPRNLRGEQLEAAVNALLKEMGSAPAKAAR